MGLYRKLFFRRSSTIIFIEKFQISKMTKVRASSTGVDVPLANVPLTYRFGGRSSSTRQRWEFFTGDVREAHLLLVNGAGNWTREVSSKGILTVIGVDVKPQSPQR